MFLDCPPDLGFDRAPSNTTAIADCGIGFSGTQTRKCGEGQDWIEAPYRIECTRKICFNFNYGNFRSNLIHKENNFTVK